MVPVTDADLIRKMDELKRRFSALVEVVAEYDAMLTVILREAGKGCHLSGTGLATVFADRERLFRVVASVMDCTPEKLGGKRWRV